LRSIDANIDDLYRLPLSGFVSARAGLAKSLAGADAARVRSLRKPTVVPWAVNQVFWRARPVYDRVMKTGERLRQAQVAALGGGKADVRAPGEAHRRAIADAVREAERFAAADHAHADPGALTRTFEALSLASTPPADPGRLTRPLQPAGFEALAGIPVKIQVKRPAQIEAKAPDEAAQRVKKRRDAAVKKVKKAEAAVERARRRMLAAEAALRRTRDQAS
jgi:hypothetical protein